jgi:t-SNARE complex subunit (syntaxin)
VEEPQAVSAPLGAVEAMQEAPLHQAERESWMQDVAPALRSLQEKMTAAGMEGSGGYADQVRAAARRANPEATPEEIEAVVQDANKQLKAYLGGVYQDMKGEKLASHALRREHARLHPIELWAALRL